MVRRLKFFKGTGIKNGKRKDLGGSVKFSKGKAIMEFKKNFPRFKKIVVSKGELVAKKRR